MHDFQPSTAEAIPALLRKLKAEGYKVVHVKAREQLKTVAQYDEEITKDLKLPHRQHAADVECGPHHRGITAPNAVKLP